MRPVDPLRVVALANDLSLHQVRHVFVFVSYLKPDGTFNQTYDHSHDFVSSLKAARPNLIVQAWVGLPLQGAGPGYVNLSEEATRQSIARFAKEMVSVGGFDGVHLDPEPVADGDPYLLSLLDEVRGGLGQNTLLSLASRRISPLPTGPGLPILGGLTWSASYYQDVASRVSQVALMTYDSGMPLSQLYRWWTRLQVVALSRALANSHVDLLIGVPTSEERTRTHWPNAENMASGLLGVVDGLNDPASRPDIVTGVAIYPHWETDDAEWATYDALWLGR